MIYMYIDTRLVQNIINMCVCACVCAQVRCVYQTFITSTKTVGTTYLTPSFALGRCDEHTHP
jgi:hypothetical protein